MAPSADKFDAILINLVELFNKYKINYALIGGHAVSQQTRPRFTKDLDFLLDVPQLVLPRLLEEVHQHGQGHFDVVAVTKEWVQHHMVNFDFQDLRIDWLKPLIPLYQHILQRSVERIVEGTTVKMASPEGLVLLKLLAFRSSDQADIEALIAVHGASLDKDWIEKEWTSVGEADDPPMKWFRETYQNICGTLPPS